MAEKRMFTKKIIDSDDFLEMPLSTQALYFHLNMRADDDGFVNNPKRITAYVGASADDLKLLIAKRFLLCFETGVIVIKHWRMHNTLRKDRHTPTQYQELLDTLDVKDNKAYTEKSEIPAEIPAEIPPALPVATTWQPTGNQPATQYSKDKNSIEEDNICASDDAGVGVPEVNAGSKTATKTEINDFFEYLWNKYPVKKGKGQVSEAKRKALFAIGREEMDRAIDRYLQELKKDADWRKPQNGSTFFNSGYVDYLDANFVPTAENRGNYGYRGQYHGYEPQEYGNPEDFYK